MKIAVIARAETNNPQTYTTYKDKVTYHPEHLFMSKEDQCALEYALQLIEQNGGTIDVYTFEQTDVAERILHEALALGASKVTKINAGDFNDPLQQNELAGEFAHYLQEKGLIYDLLLMGYSPFSTSGAILAAELKMSYYDQIATIDPALNFEMKLEKGQITGKCSLPAVVTTLSSINVPRLPNFVALSQAINSSIATISFNRQEKAKTSALSVKHDQKERVIFDLAQDPQSCEKLVTVLKQNGILR